MRFRSVETSQAFMHRVILPLAALVIGLLVFAIGGIFWIAEYQTRVAVEQQVRLAKGAFRIQAQKLATSASDYGYWDDAVIAIVERPDATWMNDNIGAGAEKSLGVNMAFALDPNGKAIYSHVSGRNGTQNPKDVLGDAFQRAFDHWKSLPANETYADMLPYNGTAIIMAIAPVRSFTNAQQKPTGHSIVFIKTIGPAFMTQMAEDFELANFRIVETGVELPHKLGVISITDGRSDGQAVRFTWDPQQPGDGLLRIALPFMAVFLLLLILLAGIVLKYVVASAQMITDRENKAACDPLTGLANRSRFFAALELGISRILPGLSGITVMYIDLDGFKNINDTMGHAAGDQLLIDAASRFKACVRDTDLVARLGGDEFAIILNSITGGNQVQAVGARILQSMAEPFNLAAGTAQASCSIGVADSWNKDLSGADLLNLADRALYEAKASGKNALRFHGASVAEPDRKVA